MDEFFVVVVDGIVLVFVFVFVTLDRRAEGDGQLQSDEKGNKDGPLHCWTVSSSGANKRALGEENETKNVR